MGGARKVSRLTASRQRQTVSSGRSSPETGRHTVTEQERQKGQLILRDSIQKKPHHLFKWMDVDAGRENEFIRAEEIVEEHGVTEEILHHYIVGEIMGEKNVLSLPWAILSMVLYALMMLGKEDINWHNSLDHAIEYDIAENANFAFSAPGYIGHKNFQDVNCHADFWSWMNKGFMPLICPEESPTSEDSGVDLGNLTALQKNRYLWHSAKVGPVKLAQERFVGKPCVNADMQYGFRLHCAATPELELSLRPTDNLVAQSTFHEDASSTVWLNGFGAENKQQLKDLETDVWLNKNTSRVKLSFLTYEADHDILRLTTVNFLFSETGRIWKQFTERTLVLRPYYSPWAYIFDILFYLNVTCVFGCEVLELIAHLRKSRWSLLHGLKDYMGLWNAVDWLFIAVSYCVLVLWLVRLDKLGKMESVVLDLPPEAATCSSDCAAYYADIFDRIEDLGLFARTSFIMFAIGPLVVMLRLFKAFSAQPRLALVTHTMRKASTNLAHYIIIFLAMFSTYAVMGVALFGRDIPAFATLDRALPALLAAALGDFDFDAATKIGRGFAFVFYAAFMMIIVLVMLSMLIAIIMEEYIEVKSAALKSETLWMEMADILRRSWQNFKKMRVCLDSIRKTLDADSKAVVTVQSFMQRVSGLPEWQARRLMTEAVQEFASENSQEPSNLEVKQFTDDVVHMLTGAVGADMIHHHLKVTVADENDVTVGRNSIQLEETDPEKEAAATRQASLAALDLAQLLDLAAKRLERGSATPYYEEGFDKLIQHALGIAQSLSSTMLSSVKI